MVAIIGAALMGLGGVVTAGAATGAAAGVIGGVVAAGAIAGGELGICLSPARTIMGVRQ